MSVFQSFRFFTSYYLVYITSSLDHLHLSSSILILFAIYIGLSNRAARLTAHSTSVCYYLTTRMNQLQARIDALRQRMSGNAARTSDEKQIAEQLISGKFCLTVS